MQHSIIYEYAWATIHLVGVIAGGLVVIGIAWAAWVRNR